MNKKLPSRSAHVFLFFAVVVFSLISIVFLDRRLVLFFQQAPGQLLQVFEVITRAGISTGYIVGSALLFVFFQWVRRRRVPANQALLIFMSVSLAGVINAVLKFFFGRYRPKAFLEQGLYGFTFFKTEYLATSFPSGHANTVGAVMLGLCLICPRYRAVFLGVAFCVILSRMILCAHYLSDVVLGVYIGAMTALWLSSQMDRRGLVYRPSVESP